MATRKATPDVLGEVLGGEPAPSQPTPPAEPKRRPPARSKRQRTAPKRPRWEYMEVVFRDYSGYRPRRVNGEEQRDWKNAPVIFHYLNQLGDEGWELVGVGGRYNDEMPAYFRRQKA
jgi:hypothetical protein